MSGFSLVCHDVHDHDDEVGDGLHEMTDEEEKRYHEQVAESGGFDVEPFPGVFSIGTIVPVDLDCDPKLLHEVINLAIEYHNKTNNGKKKIRLKEPLKWNVQAMCPANYYLTFKAEDEETHEVETYQAKVIGRIPRSETYVGVFRVKPKNRTSDDSPPEGSSSKKPSS